MYDILRIKVLVEVIFGVVIRTAYGVTEVKLCSFLSSALEGCD
jgi:hypothetical protein